MASWNLAPCGQEQSDAWAEHERVLRAAAPGSPHYLPKPFPRDSAQVIEDYVYELRRLWPTRDEVPEDMRGIYDGVQSNSLRFEVVTVDNWTTTRCGRQTERSVYYLIRFIRAADGVEIGRTTLTDAGFLAVQVPAVAKASSLSLDERRFGFLELKEAMARVQSDYGILGRDPQYAAVFGVPLRCESTAPCVAFRAGDDTYLISPRLDVLQLSRGARRLDREMETQDRMSAVAALNLQPDEAVVSLGGEAFALGRRVGQLRKR